MDARTLNTHYAALQFDPQYVIDRIGDFCPSAMAALRMAPIETHIAIGFAVGTIVKIYGRRWAVEHGVEGYKGRGGDEDRVKLDYAEAELLCHMSSLHFRVFIAEVKRIPWKLKETEA